MAEISLPYNWVPRGYQLPLWNYMEGPEPGKRAACLWHRRAGKDLISINICATKAFERVGTYWHMLPSYKQGRNIVWTGCTKDGRQFLDYFPKETIANRNNTEMRLTLVNNSIYQVVGTDNIDSLVGTNPVGVVFSEFSLHDPKAWDYVRPILAENDGWAIFIFTARGKNHAFHLMKMAERNKIWFSQTLTAGSGPRATKRPDGTPVISDAIIEEERNSLMPEEMIQQEFYCSFEAPMVGSYYGIQMTWLDKQRQHSPEEIAADLKLDVSSRFTSVPWDPKLPVNTAWDIGIGDATSIWFTQEYGMEIRVIDFYENSGEGLQHYVKYLKDKPYVYDRHFAPHDIEVREFSSGKARIDTAKELGIKFTVVPLHSVEDGINAVRNILPMCWFDLTKAARGIQCLREYRKDWNEERKVFNNQPLHNWASHGADAFRIFAWGRKQKKKNKGLPQNKAVDEHNYLSTNQQSGDDGQDESTYGQSRRRRYESA